MVDNSGNLASHAHGSIILYFYLRKGNLFVAVVDQTTQTSLHHTQKGRMHMLNTATLLIVSAVELIMLSWCPFFFYPL
jgi:hypothetical protein